MGLNSAFTQVSKSIWILNFTNVLYVWKGTLNTKEFKLTLTRPWRLTNNLNSHFLELSVLAFIDLCRRLFPSDSLLLSLLKAMVERAQTTTKENEWKRKKFSFCFKKPFLLWRRLQNFEICLNHSLSIFNLPFELRVLEWKKSCWVQAYQIY